MPCRATPPSRPTSFLHLPAEIRNTIYELALIAPFEVDATFLIPAPQPFILAGAFLRTCKQVHFEATSILYSRNTFRIGDNTQNMQRSLYWISCIGSNNASLVRKIALELRSLDDAIANLSLELLREIRRVTQVSQLGIWVRYQSKVSMQMVKLFAEELQAFTSLEEVTIGGRYPTWWGGRLANALECPGGGVELELAPPGSPLWLQRRDNRRFWAKKIVEDAECIRDEQLRRKMKEWETGKPKAVAESDAVGRGDCVGISHASGSRAGDDREALQEKGNRCLCRDCKWVRRCGTPVQRALTCFEVHEWAANGGIEGAVQFRDLAEKAVMEEERRWS